MSADNKQGQLAPETDVSKQETPEQETSAQETSEQETSAQEAINEKAPWTAKRVAAIIGIVLLVGLYVLTLVSAFLGSEGAGRLFRFSLGMTIAVPIFLWVFIWCVGRFQNKRNMASLDILSSNSKEREKMEKAVQEEMSRQKSKES